MQKILSFVVSLIVILLFIVILKNYFPDSLQNEHNKYNLIIYIIVLTSILARLLHSNIGWKKRLKEISGWIIITLVIFLGYSYRYEVNDIKIRLIANIVPGYGQKNSDGSINFYSNNNGHFAIRALVNNKANINFMLDTGASTVSLTAQDARKLGIDMAKLNFNQQMSTANGVNFAARIYLQSIQIDSIILENIEATIMQQGLDQSLLGMSFLSNLQEFTIKKNLLTLKN
jgi:aspartyl protease family protein